MKAVLTLPKSLSQEAQQLHANPARVYKLFDNKERLFCDGGRIQGRKSHSHSAQGLGSCARLEGNDKSSSYETTG